MTFARGEHVVVHQFIRRGDDTDTDTFDGWVVAHGGHFITIANTPDWADLDPDDYYTASYRLDHVIVTPYTPELGDETGMTQPLFMLAAAGDGTVILGLLLEAPEAAGFGLFITVTVTVTAVWPTVTRLFNRFTDRKANQ